MIVFVILPLKTGWLQLRVLPAQLRRQRLLKFAFGAPHHKSAFP
jgi:hypothetical protein